jgi:hypothetical protein
MSYKREGEHVTLEMTSDDYGGLLVLLGYATGAMRQRGDEMFWDALRFVNRLNEGNSAFTPYSIPDHKATDGAL